MHVYYHRVAYRIVTFNQAIATQNKKVFGVDKCQFLVEHICLFLFFVLSKLIQLDASVTFAQMAGCNRPASKGEP